MSSFFEDLKKNEELIKKEADKLIKERESKFKKHKSNPHQKEKCCLDITRHVVFYWWMSLFGSMQKFQKIVW